MTVGALPDDVDIPVREQIESVSFTLRTRHLRRRSTARRSRPLLQMVDRAEFDLALVRAAQDRGAVLQQETMVRSVQEQAGRVRLSTDAGTVWARSVVGCDGSAGRIGRYVGVEMAQVDLGLELELELTGPHRHDWSRRIHLDWGPLPGSYGWVFPKTDWLTVGVIAARGAGTATRAYLTELVAGLGLDQLPVLRSSGHLTQCRRDGSPLRRGRVLVAGDAAGLLEPWTREGISFAVRSGHLAGRTAAEMSRVPDSEAVSVAGRYSDEIDRGLGVEMRTGRRLATDDDGAERDRQDPASGEAPGSISGMPASLRLRLLQSSGGHRSGGVRSSSGELGAWCLGDIHTGHGSVTDLGSVLRQH